MQGNVWLGNLRNDVVFGADAQYRVFYRADLLRQTAVPGFSIYNPVYGREVPSSTVSATDSTRTDKLGTQSGFLQDTLYLTEPAPAEISRQSLPGLSAIGRKGPPYTSSPTPIPTAASCCRWPA